MYKYLEQLEEILDNIISNENNDTVEAFLKAAKERIKELEEE